MIDAESGDRIEQLRLQGVKQTGGRFGSLDYPSPVMIGDRLFYMNGSGQMFVFKTGDNLEQIAVNEVTDQKEIFWGSPAISDGNLVLRSQKHLYCVTNKGEKVERKESAEAEEQPETPPQARRGGGRPGGGGASGGGRRQFDPMSMFNGMDADKDGKISMGELEGNRNAERLKTLDKDGDSAISKDEFTSGIRTLFSRGGNRGSSRGGGGAGGYGRGTDTRPDRPQRPSAAGK